MNYFTKDELTVLHLGIMTEIHKYEGILKPSPFRGFMLKLRDKMEAMIEDYTNPKNVQIIGTGQLLFHDKSAASAILPKIHKQLDLCENQNEDKAFRIDWRIIYGCKFGHTWV